MITKISYAICLFFMMSVCIVCASVSIDEANLSVHEDLITNNPENSNTSLNYADPYFWISPPLLTKR